jgi:triosephosphate isomerase
MKIIILLKNIDTTKVLYGGSVKPDNAEKIMSIDNVDGTLIGGASLNVKDFLAIYCSAVKQIKVIS